MKYAWIGALVFFLFVTVFFQKSGSIGWIASALSFSLFVYLYIAFGDRNEFDTPEEDATDDDDTEDALSEEVREEAHKEEDSAEINITLHFTVDPKEFLKACYLNDIDKVVEMVESGVDVNTANHQGVNALMFAVKGKGYDVAAYLIENGADVTAVSEKGTTALSIAESTDDEKMKSIINGN